MSICRGPGYKLQRANKTMGELRSESDSSGLRLQPSLRQSTVETKTASTVKARFG